MPIITLGILFIVVGFGFKVSAVPFHTWAPDTYEGAPTPIAAFLAVASKAAGFVALLALVFVAFPGRCDVVEPLMWVLSAVTMTVGNLIALRQTNIVRMLAYSSVAQAGFMLAPLAVVGDAGQEALTAVVVYLIIYTAMNLGAFAVVIAVARRTGSGEIDSYRGLFQYSPALAVLMSVFLFALAGIPPLGGLGGQVRGLPGPARRPGPSSGAVLAVVVAVNSVIALFYYANVARLMWFQEAPEGDDHAHPGAVLAQPPPSASPSSAPWPSASSPAWSPTSATWPTSPPPRSPDRASVLGGHGGRALRARGVLRAGRGGRRAARRLPHRPRGRAPLRRRARPGPGCLVGRAGSTGRLHRLRRRGRGRARWAAAWRCAGSPHRYVAVDRSAAQRARHEGLESAADLPDGPLVGVVVANELLDNLPFDLTRRRPSPSIPDQDWPDDGPGAPRQDQARQMGRGRAGPAQRPRWSSLDYVVDHGRPWPTRPWTEWLRTYRGHERGGHPMDHLGEQDITVEVAVDQLPGARRGPQPGRVPPSLGHRRAGGGGPADLARAGPPR